MGQRIAIISAVHEELSEILALMPDEKQTVIGGRTFWSGHLQGHEVVTVLSGMGKVAAATTATTLCEHFAPEQVIFTGVAGGLAPGVEVGDIVVGTGFLQHDLDASPLYPRWEVPGYAQQWFKADGALTQVLHAAAKDAVTWLPKLLDETTLRGLGLHTPSVHEGDVITGDRFVATETESARLRADLPQALAVDMESAAVAMVCHDYGLPFGAVRTISDRADQSAHLDFQHFLNQVARHYSSRIIRKALNLL
jgi:adenosylhomocysteine nucleosidase